MMLNVSAVIYWTLRRSLPGPHLQNSWRWLQTGIISIILHDASLGIMLLMSLLYIYLAQGGAARHRFVRGGFCGIKFGASLSVAFRARQALHPRQVTSRVNDWGELLCGGADGYVHQILAAACRHRALERRRADAGQHMLCKRLLPRMAPLHRLNENLAACFRSCRP